MALIVTLPPEQKVVFPLALTEGAAGDWLTVTLNPVLWVEVPSELVAVAVYVPVALAT